VLPAACFALTLGVASVASAQSRSNGCPDPLARSTAGEQTGVDTNYKARPTQGIPPSVADQSQPRPRFSNSGQVARNTAGEGTGVDTNYKARPTQGLPPGQYEQSQPRPRFQQNARTASNAPC
jgi:hypothetical protein